MAVNSGICAWCGHDGNKSTHENKEYQNMKTIYKYPLLITDSQSIEMPKNAEFLTVQIQQGKPYLWAIVDTKNTYVKREILIRGTGHNVAGLGRYISTFQMQEGALIFHAFEA